jgi:hypothetical protein
MQGYICGTMNGVGAAWIAIGCDKSNMALAIIGVAVFVGQWVVQLAWPQHSAKGE